MQALVTALLYSLLSWIFLQYVKLATTLVHWACAALGLGLHLLTTMALSGDEGSSNVDPPAYHALTCAVIGESESKKVIQKTSTEVELLNGACRLKKSVDPDLYGRCNDALNKMNDFQREFLSIGPKGKPNMVLFTEVVFEDAAGNQEIQSSFESIDKDNLSTPKKLFNKFKNKLTTNKLN